MHVFYVSEAVLNGSWCAVRFLDAGSRFCFNPWGKLRSQKIPSIHHVHNVLWVLWSAYVTKLHSHNDPQTEGFLSFLQNWEAGVHSGHTDSQLGGERLGAEASRSLRTPHCLCFVLMRFSTQAASLYSQRETWVRPQSVSLLPSLFLCPFCLSVSLQPPVSGDISVTVFGAGFLMHYQHQ